MQPEQSGDAIYGLQQRIGLVRSLLIYHGNPAKTRRMVRFYGQFLGANDLAFDIGAHVGDRLRVWSKLGVRSVAVEPQPLFMAFLRRLYGRNDAVTLVDRAVGAAPGQAEMLISARTPTVSTLSPSWADEVTRAESFASVRWERTTPVSVITLDQLIEEYGLPAFCKIDVEGYELEALRGLSQPLPALSFEFVPAAPEVALGCLERLQTLAVYEYNWSRGERHRWECDDWISPQAMATRLQQMSADEDSGDIYARRREETK